MNTLPSLYDYVMACLRSRAIPQREVARGSGVPFSTVTKIAQGSVTEPSVHTVQKLYDYFMRRGVAQPSVSRPPSSSGPTAPLAQELNPTAEAMPRTSRGRTPAEGVHAIQPQDAA